MIHPEPDDCGRQVCFKRGDGTTVTGPLTGFGPHYCYVTIQEISTPVRREDLEWVGEKPKPGESPRALAARSRLEAEGFSIEEAGDHHWLIEGFSFWPEIWMWRRPDGAIGPTGVAELIEELRRARARRL